MSFSEDFEGDEGLAGWTLDEEFVYNDNSLPWEQVFNAPEHSGGTAFSPDPTTGQCDGGPNDLTSRTGLVSPDLTVPTVRARASPSTTTWRPRRSGTAPTSR